MTAYEVLGIPEGSSPEVIKRAYRRLALQYHPDRNKSPEAETRFIEINEAYEELIEGKVRQSTTGFSSSDFTDIFNEEFIRQRQRRRRAEEYARRKQAAFEEEVESFRSSRYYYLLTALVFLFIFGIVGGALALLAYPVYLYRHGHDGSILLLECIFVPLSIVIISGAISTFNSFRPYMRDHWEKPSLKHFSLEKALSLFDISLHPFRLTIYTFIKLAILFPLTLSSMAVLDGILPARSSLEVVQDWSSSHVKRSTVTLYQTQHFHFRQEQMEYTLDVGDSVLVRYTPILKIVTGTRPVNNPNIRGTGYMKPHQNIYALWIFLPLMLMAVSLFGLLAENPNEISGGFIISLIFLLVAYSFLT